MTLGQKLQDAIIGNNLMSPRCADNDNHAVICVWSSAAQEQVEAIVEDHYRPIIDALKSEISNLKSEINQPPGIS